MKTTESRDQLILHEEKLAKILERAAEALVDPPVELQFSVCESTKQLSIKMINTKNGEVIREIPPEKVLDMMIRINELVEPYIDKKSQT